jgi:hypothetical protein
VGRPYMCGVIKKSEAVWPRSLVTDFPVYLSATSGNRTEAVKVIRKIKADS